MPAAQLTANPANWRTHGEGQRAALSALLRDVGYADALIARETESGELILIDGQRCLK